MRGVRYYRGMVQGTGYPIDGLELTFATYDYDCHSCYHLYSWTGDQDDKVMESIHKADPLCASMPLSEFALLWKAGEYRPLGAFYVPLDNITGAQEIIMASNSFLSGIR